MDILFLCSQNANHSKTAEDYFKERFNTASASLFNDTPVTKAHLEWADTIAVIEEHQRSELAIRFPDTYLQKRILNMDIPDIFRRDQPELLEILKERSDLF